MDLTVIIVNWNGRPHLFETLDALTQQTLQPKRIVVVDNGSEDGSEADLRALEMPHLVKVFKDTNLGFAGGNNAALPHLVGEAVALLNNDAVPDPNWLAACAESLQERPDVGMVACKIVRKEMPSVIDKCGHLMYPDGLNRGWGTGEQDDPRFQSSREVLWPDGCAAIFRREGIDDVGFFDEDFFCYGEDADLGFRMRWAGYRCVFNPQALVYHRHSASLGKFSPYKAYLIERNRWWVLIKNFPISWILWSSVATMIRYGYNLVSLLFGKGSASGFQSEHGSGSLVWTLIKANFDGIRGIPKAWRKRRAIKRRITSKEMKAILRTYKISAREITLQD
jgi:GT2 family glycosyltransferase